MIIDAHVHPGFLAKTGALTEEELEFRQNMMGLYKTDEIDIEAWMNMYDYAKVDRLFLLPLDLTTTDGGCVGTNEETAKLAEDYPDRFYGFASVDPHRKDALEVLEKAFTDQKLVGLKLHPSKQKFYPDDEEVFPIYEMCIKYNRPVIFHAGVSMEPGTLVKYSHPLRFEEVAYKFPTLRICLAHFGWPWVKETCMLMLKYRNIYTDTAMLYFDNPKEFYAQCLGVDIGPHWIDRSLRHQVMFGSDEPRLEMLRMIQAVREMDIRETTKNMILGDNAIQFLNGGI